MTQVLQHRDPLLALRDGLQNRAPAPGKAPLALVPALLREEVAVRS